MTISKGLFVAAAAALAVANLATVPALAAPQAAPKAADKVVTATDRDNNETVNLNVGDTLIVRLKSNPSTGYSWKVGQINQQLLRLIGDPKYEASTSGLIGAPGEQVFEFEARAPGGEQLVLLYQNPSLRGVQAANTFRLRTLITGNEPQPAGRTIVVTDDDNNETIDVAENDTLIVRLQSNPSTGYSWTVAENVDLILKPQGNRYVRPATTRPGAGGYQEFTFKVVGNGEVSLKLLYQRPWQKSTQAAKAWQMYVISPRPGEQPVGAPVSFVCAGASNANFTVEFGDKTATVTYNGVTKVLPQKEAADGFDYADAAWELRGKGNEATLTDLATGKPVGENCTAQPSAAVSAPTTILATYTCDGGVTFTATFGGDVASVTYNNLTQTLKQQEAADGFLYADATGELRGKGNDATLTDLTTGKAVGTNCKSDAAPAAPTATTTTATETVTTTAPVTATAAGAASAAPTILTTYTCDGGVTFTATFGNNIAAVTFNNVTKVLPRQATADGFHYADSAWDLRGKGNDATLTDLTSGKAVASNCKAQQ